MARILYVCHGHPAFLPGGTEIYALELLNAMQACRDHEAFLLARAQPGLGDRVGPAGARIVAFEGHAGQFLFLVGLDEVNPFLNSLRHKDLVTETYREFLLSLQPDVVHFQHTLNLGYQLVRETRNLLPHAAIVYTLHEFAPICWRNGQMVRTNGELCYAASPESCQACFPERTLADFWLRRRFAQSHLGLVDLFLSPSGFLQQRYVEWGLPPERIRVEDNGRNLARQRVPRPPPHNRFGFFGRIERAKGADVLLRAAGELAEGPDCLPIEVRFHGIGLDQWPDLAGEAEAFPTRPGCEVHFAGGYQPSDQAGLLAEVDWVVVPSVWWENSPLVIQEAFAAGRPVICSGIGGMAEKVADDVNGLHFEAGNHASLAQVMRRAVETPGLWERLVAGIPDVYRIEDAAEVLAALYADLLASRRAPIRWR